MRSKRQVPGLRIQSPRFSASFYYVLRLVSCVLCLICVLGCYGNEVVRIRVRMDSKVDVKNYSKIAVMDFIDSRSNSITKQGKILARMIRKQLRKSIHKLEKQ